MQSEIKQANETEVPEQDLPAFVVWNDVSIYTMLSIKTAVYLTIISIK